MTTKQGETRLTERLQRDIPYPVIVTAAWSICALLIAGGLWLVGTFTSKVMIVVVPVAIAMLLAALLTPMHVKLTTKLHFPRGLSALTCVLSLITIVALGLTFAVNQFASGYVTLASKAQQGLDSLIDWLHTGPFQIPQKNGASMLDSVSEFMKSNSDKLVSNAVDAGATTVDYIAGVLICLIAMFFFIYDGPRIARYLLGWLPKNIQAPAWTAAAAAWVSLKGYTRMQVVVAAINATGIGIGAWILGIPLVIPVTVVVFLCSFVPIVGALISGAIAVLIAFVDGGIVHALIMLGIVIGVHLVETHVLQPFLMGHALSVHPLAVIIVVAMGTYLFGLPGALFAVPITAMLNAAVKAVQTTPVPDQEEHLSKYPYGEAIGPGVRNTD
ncbi:AI-2E family transporter [Corynebacterium sp. 4HC-13]|uniref:AI-2E family transporter n=1 Tax=Corynebacterium anserum TaxID=2684406 RepID=UPI00163A30F8|nr:AI-2E family transporter [Corynebacterium anserum]MBC2682005.1 AI-2E family transporter [Corynebacterium anserum]